MERGKEKSSPETVEASEPAAEVNVDGHENEVLAAFSTEVFANGAVHATAKYPPGKMDAYAIKDMLGRLLKAAGVKESM